MIYTATTVSGIYQYINGMYGGPRAGIGDTVLISGGFFTPDAQVGVPSLQPQPGVTIQKYPGTTPTLIGRNTTLTLQVLGSGTSTWYDNPIVISGVNWSAGFASGTMDIADYGWYSFKGCTVKIYDGSFEGASSQQSKNCFTAEAASGKPVYVELYRCTVAKAGNDVCSTKADVNDGVPDAQRSYIKAYDCYFHSPGQKAGGGSQASNDQIITAHEGIPIYVYGGRLENGIICAGADGYHFIYFADIDGAYITPGSSGQTQALDIRDAFVTYGNYINHKGTICGNTIDGTTGGRSWVASAGHSGIRSYALVKDNFIVWNGRAVGNEGIFSNTLTTVSGGNYAVISNMILQSGGFTGDNFLVRQYPGYASITGIVHSNIIIGTNASNNGPMGVKMAETYISGGVTFTNFIYNNTSISGKSIVAYSSATIPSGQGSRTYLANNFMTVGFPYDSASVDHTWGYIYSSGNLFVQAQPSNFNAPLFTTFRDNYSTVAHISGAKFSYYPTPNGNLDFGSGVTPSIIKALDGVNETNYGPNFRGAKSRQKYDQTVFPSFIM